MWITYFTTTPSHHFSLIMHPEAEAGLVTKDFIRGPIEFSLDKGADGCFDFQLSKVVLRVDDNNKAKTYTYTAI